MMKIFKYLLTGTSAIPMPKGQHILTAQFQGDELYVWASVNPDAEIEMVRFEVIGTGHAFEENSRRFYISTAQSDGYVWHVFQILK